MTTPSDTPQGGPSCRLVVLNGVALDAEAFAAIDAHFLDMTTRGARGEIAWICPSCCMYFEEGMPDNCFYGHEGCTKLNMRDKAQASK